MIVQRARAVSPPCKVRAFRRAAREELFSDFELILAHRYLVVALTVTLLGIALFSNPPPPSRVVLAAGAPGSAYSAFAEDYAKFFAARGIKLDVRQTQGALENARLVADPSSEVELAFIQAGLLDPRAAAHIRSLGSLNYEPIWLFFRGNDNGGKLQKFMELGQRRIAIGPAESGSYATATRLLALNKQPLDAVLLVDGVGSEKIRALVKKSELQLANFARAAAYAKSITAEAVNGNESFFEKRGEFPAFKNDDIAESEEAKIFYKSGATRPFGALRQKIPVHLWYRRAAISSSGEALMSRPFVFRWTAPTSPLAGTLATHELPGAQTEQASH